MQLDYYRGDFTIAPLFHCVFAGIAATAEAQPTEFFPEPFMSHHDHQVSDQVSDANFDHNVEPDPADSRADAIAAFFAIMIAVCGVLFFISQH